MSFALDVLLLSVYQKGFSGMLSSAGRILDISELRVKLALAGKGAAFHYKLGTKYR